jgi:ABC-type tungstate transport system permease subunit
VPSPGLKGHAWWIALMLCAFHSAFAQPFASGFVPNPRALRFVTTIVLNDFHTAQAGGGYVFSYARDETDATLTDRLERWLSARDPQALNMEAAEKRLLFGFYWAASMMPARSPCFGTMANDACQEELSHWMAREAGYDPRFVRDYEAARTPLGLPPLLAGGH